MFRPGQPAVVRETGETVTVAGYETRTSVNVSTCTGPKTLPEAELRRPLSKEDTQVLKFVSTGTQSYDEREPKGFGSKGEDFETTRMLQLEVSARLGEALSTKRLVMDWNGHNSHLTPKQLDEYLSRERFVYYGLPTDTETLTALNTALMFGVALPAPIVIQYGCQLQCGVCGKKYELDLECDGVNLRITDRCAMTDWDFKTTVEINVPSGKILARDDLRFLCGLPNGHNDVNGIAGQHQEMVMYGKAGMAHGSVGNSCPGIYKERGVKDGYLIGSPASNEYYDEGTDKYVKIPKKDLPEFPGTKRVGGICTDLWWYSMIDLDEAKRRAEHFGQEDPEEEGSVFSVKPGVYRVVHDNKVHRDGPGPTIFARFVRVGPPLVDPPDYLKTMDSFQVTAEQAVAANIARWPTLYKCAEYRDSAAAVARQFFFSGRIPSRDWHPNGFPNSFSPWDVDLPSVSEAPVISPFHMQCAFGDIGDSNIATAVLGKDPMYGGDCPMNPSFAFLAFNVLESVISYGVPVTMHRDQEVGTSYGLPHKDMQDAVRLYHGLAKRYPDAVEPRFHAWMQNEAEVQRWVTEWFHGIVVPEVVVPGMQVVDLETGDFGRVVWNDNGKKPPKGKCYVEFGEKWSKPKTLALTRVKVVQGEGKSLLTAEEQQAVKPTETELALERGAKGLRRDLRVWLAEAKAKEEAAVAALEEKKAV